MSSRNGPTASSLVSRPQRPREANVALLTADDRARVPVHHVRVRVQPEPAEDVEAGPVEREVVAVVEVRVGGRGDVDRRAPSGGTGSRRRDSAALIASGVRHGTDSDSRPRRPPRAPAGGDRRAPPDAARARAAERARRADDRADAGRRPRRARRAGRLDRRPRDPGASPVGVSPEEIWGSVLAVAPLVGVPRLIGAVPAIRAALDG